MNGVAQSAPSRDESLGDFTSVFDNIDISERSHPRAESDATLVHRARSELGRHVNVVAILGCQWGDEAKGKLVGLMATSADVCCRFNGGSNAGHTLVVKNERYPLHLVPCGILCPQTENFIGNGVVLHLKTLISELDSLSTNVPNIVQRLFISNRAHLLFDFHKQADAALEEKRAAIGRNLGTTCKGIGPCYAAKSSRLNVRVGDLFHWERFEAKYRQLLSFVESSYNISFEGAEDELNRHAAYFDRIRSQIVDGVEWIHEKIAQNKKCLVEGANATLLDLDFGTYPFVTSSSTVAGGVCTGLGIAPQRLERLIGVMKAYTTRVGLGPFPTELNDDVGEFLRKQGMEYGTTTGRPRRCGWFDAVLVRYSILVNGITALNLTKLDVLSTLSTLRVCTAYRNKLTDTLLPETQIPCTAEDFNDVEPVYETLNGWNASISNCRFYEELPTNAKIYIQYLEKLVKCPILWVGVGPDVSQTISCVQRQAFSTLHTHE